MELTKSREDKNSVYISPISISRADMESLFLFKSQFMDSIKLFNKANDDDGHSIIIICCVERKIMPNENQCMVVEMNKSHLIISCKMNNSNECN